MDNGNIVCLLSPEGYGEEDIKNNNGSISIIGYEQLGLIRQHSGIERLALFNAHVQTNPNDVLLIMMCLPNVKMQTLERFSKIIYYFDDMNCSKANKEPYRERMAKVDLYISPLANVAREMNDAKIKRSYCIPWSMQKNQLNISKSIHPSVLIDMDERQFASSSIKFGFEFARYCVAMNVDAFVFRRFQSECPHDLHSRIKFIDYMPHKKFLEFLSQTWFYASGIASSYEYAVMESAMLGCGLISLNDAIVPGHLNRSCCIRQPLDENFPAVLKKAIDTFDPRQIAADAEKIYPRDGSKALKPIIAENFELLV